MINEILIKNIVTNETIQIGGEDNYTYVLDSIDWDSPAISHETYRVPKQIGETKVGVMVSTRSPLIVGYVVADMREVETSGMTWEQFYNESEKKIRKAKKDLNRIISIYQSLVIETEGYYLDCEVSKPVKYSNLEVENNKVLCLFQIELICYKPMFYQGSKVYDLALVEGNFHFPLTIPFGNNLFVPVESGWLNGGGIVTPPKSAEGTYYSATTDYITVSKNDVFLFTKGRTYPLPASEKSSDAFRICLYDSSKKMVERVPGANNKELSDWQYTVEKDNAVYMRISCSLKARPLVFKKVETKQKDYGVVFGTIMNRKSILVENEGEIPVGCVILVTAYGGIVKDPKIYNVNTGEFIAFEGVELNDGDYIRVTTEIGEENAIYHNVKTGQDESVIGNIVDGSTFLQIESGKAYYAYEVEEEYANNIELSITLVQRYINIEGM